MQPSAGTRSSRTSSNNRRNDSGSRVDRPAQPRCCTRSWGAERGRAWCSDRRCRLPPPRTLLEDDDASRIGQRDRSSSRPWPEALNPESTDPDPPRASSRRPLRSCRAQNPVPRRSCERPRFGTSAPDRRTADRMRPNSAAMAGISSSAWTCLACIRYLTSVNASGPTIAPIVIGCRDRAPAAVRKQARTHPRSPGQGRRPPRPRASGRNRPCTPSRARTVALPARKPGCGDRQLPGWTGLQLNPSGVTHRHGVEWSFQMLIGAPMARFATVMTIGRPSPEALKSASAMKRSPGWRSLYRPCADCRGADAGRHRTELDSIIRYSHATSSPSHLVGQRFDDVGLGRDGVRGDHLGTTQGHGPGNGQEPSIF